MFRGSRCADGWRQAPFEFILGHIMIPISIEFQNYRAFADRQRLELRPLTLLFGKNNAGKSAVLRSLPLLSDSLASDEMSPLDLESPSVKGAGFRDLKWQGQGRRPTIDFAFKWESGPIAMFEVRIAYEDNWKRLVPRQFRIQRRGGPIEDFRCEFLDEEQLDTVLTFRREQDDGELDGKLPVQWNGLTPDTTNEDLSGFFAEVDDALDTFSDGVQWLTSVRDAPERLVSPPGAPPRRLKPDGDGVVSTLYSNDAILRRVSDWYETHLTRRLDVVENNEMLRTVLRTTKEANFDVDLVDCGEGLIQVLPVLTALAALEQDRPYASRVLAVEEPESHLHPKLQRALAGHLCEVASNSPDRRVVLETHSEHILLGIRLAILQGRLEPDDVAIHWISQADDGRSRVERAELDENAELTGPWPPSVFGDDAEMAREIWEARRGGRASGVSE